MKQSQLQNHEGKAENSRLGNAPPHFQLFPRSVFHVKPRSLFSRWENPSTTTGGKSERICYLACLLLFLETSHAWGGWISLLNWSFKLSYTSKPQNPTNTSKQIAPIPTPPRFTWNTKPQQPIGERQRTLNAISCNSAIRSCFTWNHSSMNLIQLPRRCGSASQAINTHDFSRDKERQARWHISSDFPPGGVDMFSHRLNKTSIFRTHQTYVSRETSGSYQTLGKHNTK